MRQRGDRLAHGGEPLGLDLVAIKDRILDRQARLVADGDHEHQVVLVEPASDALLVLVLILGFTLFLARGDGQEAAGRAGVGVEDAEGDVPPLDRDADRLADTEIDDRLRGAEPFVARGVGSDDPLPLVENVVDDRREIDIRSSGSASPRQRTALGTSFPSSSLSRTAPRSAPMEVKTSSRIWGRTINVDDVADRLCGAVHDRQVHQPVHQPPHSGLGDPGAFAHRDAPENR